MRKLLIGFLFLILFASFLHACVQQKESLQRFYKGDGAYDSSIVTPLSIQEVIEKADEYTASFIAVEGKVSSICSVGCWFYIQDESGNEIYVNLAPQNFDVPQSSVGKHVKVTGVLEASEGNYRIIAFEVEFTEIPE